MVLDLERPDLRTRVGVICELLNHWPDFFEVPLRSGPGDGGVLMLPGMSRHRSVVELGRALEELQVFAPNKFVHLRGYYAAEWRTAERWRVVREKGKKRRIKERARVRATPAWVRDQKVRDAVRLVAQKPGGSALPSLRPWMFRGEPVVPAPLLERESAESEPAGVAA